MKPVKEYKKISLDVDMLLFEDGTCGFKNYRSKSVSREDYSDECMALLNYDLGAVEWVNEI